MNNQSETESKTTEKSQKTYQYVFDYFSEQILSGKMKINDKIPPEREIAEKLGVSRNSIREVMHMLEINGLIECLQGSGNYVRCDPQEYMKRSVDMVMSLMNIEYTEVFHIRTGYELVALRLAIDVASAEEVEGVHEALIKMDEYDQWGKDSSYWDNEFHKRLINASHNRLLILYYNMISEMMNQFIKDLRRRILQEKLAKEALSRSHWGIYDALINKDYISGTIAMNRHFDIVANELFKEKK